MPLTGTDPEGLVVDLQRLLTKLVMVEQMHLYPRIVLSLPALRSGAHEAAAQRAQEAVRVRTLRCRAPHVCLGATMGELQLLVTVATLLRHGRFALCPDDYELKVRVQVVRRPERGFRMRIRGR